MYDNSSNVAVAEEDLQQTQEDSQGTQPLTQPDGDVDPNRFFFGYLNPCSQALKRVDLFRDAPDVSIGRSSINKVVFPGYKISNYHATIHWNGLHGIDSVVTIEDTSSNGTFINGDKIGKGLQRMLRDGNEVAFGVAAASKEQNGLFDYRFIFRDLVSGVVKRPLYSAYDLSIELGKGSFATVYKALHMASGEWVAVKVIHETKRQPPSASGSQPASSREIKIMENLAHPNICKLREVFWNPNGSIDLILELIEGGDLLDFILTHNGLSEPMSQHITYQLCQALSYIHGKGITHRDLKPENVLLTKDEPPIVKVADFGLAKIVDSMTMLKTMCGTPSYLAPEVVTQQNNSGYDSLVDSWSVGVILFSMLTNTNPFIETSVEDLKARIADRIIDWTQLEMLRYGDSAQGYNGLSDNVQDFIHRLLDFDPRQRMKLGEALSHPWLKDYRFVYQNIDYPRIASGSGSGSVSEDVSMRSADGLSFTTAESVSQGFEHLKLSGSSGAVLHANGHAGVNGGAHHADADANANYQGEDDDRQKTPSSTPPGLTLLKKGGLQRRSEVLQQAVETGRPLVEPSWEMVNYAQSQEKTASQEASQEALYGPTPGSACDEPSPAPAPPVMSNGKGKKRVYAELTPLTEEEEEEEEGGEGGSRASSPLSSVGDSPPAPAPARKKSRSANASPEASTATPAKGKAKRGGRTPASARKVKARVDADEALPLGTRRSARAKSRR
ncbi:kinase-like domain-containing protein [Mycena galericulata]|nr:kinase-like domain-containing protein [Mycena galericulata]